MLELAYRLAVSDQPMIQRIREKLVVLINPISNPDGRDKMVDWFYRYLKGKTDRASLPRQVAALLVEICVRRYQSRHAPTDPRDHAKPFTACFMSGIRPWCTTCMKAAADDDLERHWAL